MRMPTLIPRKTLGVAKPGVMRRAFAAMAFAALCGASIIGSTPAQAAPAMPLPSQALVDDSALVPVQWGPPYGHAYGYRRQYRPYGYRPYRQRCTVVYQRRWDAWRGIWVSRPVRRCW